MINAYRRLHSPTSSTVNIPLRNMTSSPSPSPSKSPSHEKKLSLRTRPHIFLTNDSDDEDDLVMDLNSPQITFESPTKTKGRSKYSQKGHMRHRSTNSDSAPLMLGRRPDFDYDFDERDEIKSVDSVKKSKLASVVGIFRLLQPANIQAYLNRSIIAINQNKLVISVSNIIKRGHGSSTADLDRLIIPSSTPNIYPTNAVSNAKYSPIDFIPIVLYQQFKFFFNLYFLLVALSQAIPALQIGYLSSYVVPLAFVLTVTMGKEASDDIQRRRRDHESNKAAYEVLGKDTVSNRSVSSEDLKVGDLVRIYKNSRVPADMILLQSSDNSKGEVFIRTDQLDGETDWKLRISCRPTQNLSEGELTNGTIKITATPPAKSIHSFIGKMTCVINGSTSSTPLGIDNTLWANTVLASGSAVGCVIYTGIETRQALNTSKAGTKTGLLELEVNKISKILCICVFVLSFGLVALEGFGSDWYVNVMRFLILFSTIIPVSLRVNLDMGKSVYSYQIEHDNIIPNTIVRTSTIPEDLGRIEYLLSDKTGTLTQNDMEMKKLHLGTVSYGFDSMDIVKDCVSSFQPTQEGTSVAIAGNRSRRELNNRIRDLIITLCICHNVTPLFEDGEVTYQAASPDEIAIVKYTASVGLSLFKRDRTSITLLHEASHTSLQYDILHVFPFNSDSKRMGIIVKDKLKDELWFYLKGADTVMSKIVQQNDWLEEETGNMAREGLRTLVVGRKKLSRQAYETFQQKYNEASLLMADRDDSMKKVIYTMLEHDLELLGLTGVEDKLQNEVKSSLELLRNAGVKIWMLTGDKIETAKCVAISAKLVTRGQYIHQITRVHDKTTAFNEIEFLNTKNDCCLLIDGESLSVLLTHYKQEFIDVAVLLPVVIACRCTPQQKADVATLIKEATHKRVCCIGDGGNDVSMIQAADVGVGIVGKEGVQASLAADFSISQFSHLTRLMIWHGRNSYKRSAKLAQFVIHRGLIITVCQTVYSISSKFEPLALYQGWLMVGYSTLYTMAPVFSFVSDLDVDEELAKMYPELYKDLTSGKSLSYKTFFAWVGISLYQGIVIQCLSQMFTSLNAEYFTMMVVVSFTALVLNELAMVAIEIRKWNYFIILCEILTLTAYIISFPFLGEYFDLEFVAEGSFFWKCAIILATSLLPIWIAKLINKKLRPPTYAKVQES